MTNSRDEARVMFERAVEHTRGLSPATFDQWFGGVQFDDLTDGVLTLRVQNEFVLEWVKANFLPTLTAKIRELTSRSARARWWCGPRRGRATIDPRRRPQLRRRSSPPSRSRLRRCRSARRRP